MNRWQEYQKAQEKTEKLKKSNNPQDHLKVIEILKDAGNQIGIFEGIFSRLNESSDSFKKYIIPKVIEYQFYRYKCVVDGVASGFGLYFPIKDAKNFFLMANDIISGNFNKYLDTKETTIIYMLFSMLHLVDNKAHQKYFEEALISADKYKRFMAFYFTSCSRKPTINKLAICNEHFIQEDIEMYAPLLDCIPSYNAYYHKDKKYQIMSDGKVEQELIYKLCELQNRLPRKNIIYKTCEKIWFQHGIHRNEIANKIFHLLLILKNKKIINYFEENCYSNLDAKEKVIFINLFKTHIQHNYRREMLNYFNYKDDYYYKKNEYEDYFLSNPLNFEEAVIVSDYLKTKKSDIRKKIVEYFQKMPEQTKAKVKIYLENSQEEYKQEAAKDLTSHRVQEKASEEIVKQSICKLPKISVQNLAEKKILECFIKLKEFIQKNKDYQYRSIGGIDELFGSNYYSINEAGDYPLQKESEAVIKGFNLSPDELIYFEYALRLMYVNYSNCFETTTIGRKIDKLAILGENRKLALQYFIPMLRHYIKVNNSAEIQKAIVYHMIFVIEQIRIPPNAPVSYKLWSGKEEDKKPEPLWQRLMKVASDLNDEIQYDLLDNETLAIYAKVLYYSQNTPNCPNIFKNSQEVFSHLHKKGVLDHKQIFEFLINRSTDIYQILYEPTEYWQQKHKERYLYSGKHSTEYIDLVERAVMLMTDTEIARSQAETIYSHTIARCQKLFGIQYYLKALQAFQKMTLPRATYGWATTKDNVFANIVQSIVPYKTDSYDDFLKLVRELKLSDKDLIKGTLYNNNQMILEWTDKLLNKKEFISTVMFFKAHLRDMEVTKKVKDKIAIYSPIDILDFKEGAVDVDWFWHIKEEIDNETFQLIYDNAKYITIANYHKRAQRFHDALTNNLTKEECLEKIKETRNKEFILYYSLIPLNNEEDIDERYTLIMSFLQESKQFGAQRQASEKKACEVALENLARVSGYDDTDRFIWFMESKFAHQIAAYFIPREIADTLVFLSISDRFKVVLSIIRNGKELSSIPASLKSNSYLAQIKAEIPALNKQAVRVIKSFEAAMEKESKFTISELQMIAINPLIKQILNALFFVNGTKIYTFSQLIESQEKECIIAHPVDFSRLNVWQEKQKYLLTNKIRQPFKQAFRELYPKTNDELQALETNRYHGHQISVQKAIAVAKGRGWHTGEDIGLQKVFYKENIIAVIFGVWDYGYSSFNDHPTLSSIYFLNRKTFEIIPLNQINDKMFSEVMRDVDLIVSASHPQGYDFEESLSTVEVRRQICQNIIELLNLTNVVIAGNFVRINGIIGEYAINLRSAIVSKQLAGALNIMAINDSTQNKLFLNFIDDNPVTVEVVSKMLLLADDQNIKDWNIVKEIKK